MGDKVKTLKKENESLKTQLKDLSEELRTPREIVNKKLTPQDKYLTE